MKTIAGSFVIDSSSGTPCRSWSSLGLRTTLLATCLAAVLSAAPVLAANAGNDDGADPTAGGSNARALRLSSLDGQVRVVQDGQIIADPALANMPIFAGSEVTTGNDGRVEFQLEDGSVVRLSPNSTLSFPVLEKQGAGNHTEVALTNGLAYFELQPSTSENSLRVSYGGATFAATSFSVVRITLDAPPGELAVFSGNVHLDRGDSLQLDIHGGESLSLDTGDASRYNLTETIRPDSWDTWNADRDQALNAENSQQTAATSAYGTSNVGMADLDANGNWYDVPGQGYLWSPYDAQAQGVGWDPYGYGHWVFYPRYGWVWVSGYGWGYAAFNCGNWNYFDSFGWGWAPGGGCNSWWGGGGWGYNLGRYPTGYRPPRRPVLPPRQPRGGRTLLASNIVPVDRRAKGDAYQGLGARPSPVRPVTIAGHTVEPLKPVAPRETVARTGGTLAATHPANGYFPAPSRPATPGVAYQPSGSRPASSGSYHPTTSAGASHSFTPSSSGGGHVSSGGGASSGGGGGGHASSGGGGGGGGGGSHH